MRLGRIRWRVRQLRYRLPMTVSDYKLLHGTAYYICPRCRLTMEREYAAYCDRCGQKLQWK